MEEVYKDKVASIEYHPILKDFEDSFREILGLPQKRDNDLSIYLVLGVSPVSKTPYIMGTTKLKEFHMHLEDLLKKGYIDPSVSPWGVPVPFVKKKYGTFRMFIDFRLLALDQVSRKYWSCLTTFGTSIGWLKMERPGGGEMPGSHLFCGLVEQAKGLPGFMQWVKGCRPMGLPMIVPFCKCINN